MKNMFCIVALVLGGCGADELTDVATQAASSDCEQLNCPGNSDLLGVLVPYELDRTGTQLSKRGVRLLGVTHQGNQVDSFKVVGTSIYAATGGGVITGPAAVSLQLTLQHEPEAAAPRQYELVIDNYTYVPYYVGGGGFWGYHIRYREAGADRSRELCPYAEHVDAGVSGAWAVFWHGDRYDPDTGEIFASGAAADPWFNISCAGEATIKMLRAKTGYAIDPAGPVTQRQATLNMFTASYCGPTGQRYTELGQPLEWMDLSGPNQIVEVTSFEAVWDDHGAVCLTEPRLVDLGEIACGRRIPSCSETMIAQWKDHGWLLSGNPPPGP